jgi:hypothetical protein
MSHNSPLRGNTVHSSFLHKIKDNGVCESARQEEVTCVSERHKALVKDLDSKSKCLVVQVNEEDSYL